jgi:hypothetical protein
VEYKTAVEPQEWYSWKRSHPQEYKIIKAYVLQRFPVVTVEYEGQTHTNLLIPRLYFTFGEMLGFLTTYRHLQDYEHIHYTELPHYKGGTYVQIGIDFKAVSITEMCDYLWLEVRRLLKTWKNLLLFELTKLQQLEARRGKT